MCLFGEIYIKVKQYRDKMHSITVRKIRLQKIVGRNKIKTILTSSELRLISRVISLSHTYIYNQFMSDIMAALIQIFRNNASS